MVDVLLDEALLRHVLNGIYYGFVLFMIAAELTIIFGVLGILNLATANCTVSGRSWRSA